LFIFIFLRGQYEGGGWTLVVQPPAECEKIKKQGKWDRWDV
jgi:hypothetical protein